MIKSIGMYVIGYALVMKTLVFKLCPIKRFMFDIISHQFLIKGHKQWLDLVIGRS